MYQSWTLIPAPRVTKTWPLGRRSEVWQLRTRKGKAKHPAPDHLARAAKPVKTAKASEVADVPQNAAGKKSASSTKTADGKKSAAGTKASAAKKAADVKPVATKAKSAAPAKKAATRKTATKKDQA